MPLELIPCFPDRDLPYVLTGVHVDRRDLAVGRLVNRQALGTTPADPAPLNLLSPFDFLISDPPSPQCLHAHDRATADPGAESPPQSLPDITNHIGPDKPVYIRDGGYGFGLGFGVLTNSAEAPDVLSIGSYTWGGAYGTLYWADPVEDLIGILMIQIRPYNHLSIRPLFSNVVTQAVVNSLSDQKPKIMGRPTPR